MYANLVRQSLLAGARRSLATLTPSTISASAATTKTFIRQSLRIADPFGNPAHRRFLHDSSSTSVSVVPRRPFSSTNPVPELPPKNVKISTEMESGLGLGSTAAKSDGSAVAGSAGKSASTSSTTATTPINPAVPPVSEAKAQVARAMRRGPISWASAFSQLTALGICGYGLYLYIEYLRHQRAEEQKLKYTKSVGKPKLGGPISLVDHHGRRVTEADFAGKYVILYFGFTFCPDVCPVELEKISDAVKIIEQKRGPNHNFLPVLISVDPKRDTPEALAEYVKEFHPSMIGLTGSIDEIRSVAKLYRVYFSAPKDTDTDYLVDHSIFFYVMDPEWQFVDFYGQNSTAEEIAAKLMALPLKSNAKADSTAVDKKQ